MDIFDKLAGKIKNRWKEVITGLRAYFKRLLFPFYLFPIKLLTYSVYYFIKFIIKLIIAFISLIFEIITYPFRSLKNLLKSIFIVIVFVYLFISFFMVADYFINNYGHWEKFLCALKLNRNLEDKVVRVVGGYSEGTGFFITENQVLTNFHVIADEPSPKVIFPDSHFVTPKKIIGNPDADLALLYLSEDHPEMVLEFIQELAFGENEALYAAGYPLGTDLAGTATVLKGKFIAFRQSRHSAVGYIQTNINLVPGMSGGPLVDDCMKVVGVNTIGLSGLSLFITSVDVLSLMPGFTDQAITKINVDPSLSPVDAVTAFYTYLKARRMEDGFNLLSTEYLKNTDFQEWTSRFTDILDVQIFISKPYENSQDMVFVKFLTKNWNEGEVDYHYYEGTWDTVWEDGVYKMLKSNIKEVDNPGWEWFYE